MKPEDLLNPYGFQFALFPTKPHEKQKLILESKAKNKIIACGRRFGKTELIAKELIRTAVTGEHPKQIVIAPFYKQSKIVYDKIMVLCQVSPIVKEWIQTFIKTPYPKIFFKNKSTIDFGSADNPNSLRGEAYDRVMLDEAGFIKDDVMRVIRPLLFDKGAPFWKIGCITEDSLVIKPSGFEYIGRSPVGYVNKEEVLYSKNGFNHSIQRFGNPKMQTIKIITNQGYEIEGTPNHRLWDGNKWIRLDEYKKNDWICIQRGQNVFNKEYDIDLDFCYLLGLYLSEGSIEDCGRLTITNGDEEIHKFLIEKYRFKRNDKFHYRKQDVKLIKKIRDLGFLKAKAKTKIIPETIFKFTKEQQIEFLKGYFDGDGCADNRGRVSAVSVSEKLIKVLQIMLLNFGIISKRYFKISKPTKRCKVFSPQWLLEINGYSARIFFDEIGFRLTRKQQRQELNKCLVCKDKLPFDWIELKGKNKISQGWHDLKRHKTITHDRLKRFLKYYPNDKYDMISKDWFYWDKVKSIEYFSNETFDFVIPNIHSYFANGFINHNTPNGKNHFFEDYTKGLKENSEYASFNFTSLDNPYINKAEVEKDIQIHGKESLYVRTEIFAEFLEDQNSVFPWKDIQLCINPELKEEQPFKHKIYSMGVDVAKYEDFTVISIFDVTAKPYKLVYFERFNQRLWQHVIDRVNILSEQYHVRRCLVDKTGVGDVVLEQMHHAEGFLFSASSKMALINYLAGLVINHEIQLFNIPEIESELKHFEWIKSSSGHIKLEATHGVHDDIVCFCSGTNILTDKGQIPIENIKVGDYVMTRKGYKRINKIGNRYADVIERLGLIGTPEHPFITNKNIKKFINLNLQDKLYIWNEKLSSIEIKNTEKIIGEIQEEWQNTTEIIGKRKVYNLEVEECPEYFANNILVHNCSIALALYNKEIQDINWAGMIA